MKKKNRCEGLDFVEASLRHRVYPVMYCSMEIVGHLDIERLKEAVHSTCSFVPEVLCAYDFRRGQFKDIGLSVEDTLSFKKELNLWDLNSKPQLQIQISRQEGKSLIIFGMSHILTDANGFLQYLSLLASLYNDQTPAVSSRNHRKIAAFLKNIHVEKPTQQTRRGRGKNLPPFRTKSAEKIFFCLVNRISPNKFFLLHEKAKKNKVTLNTVFMAAYVRVIAKLKQIRVVTIPCPADLRRFCDTENKLTIANMTGIYRRVTIEMKPWHTFADTLLQVQIEMELQKSRYHCFTGIKPLNALYHRIPRCLLGILIKTTYRLPPISYTNIGRIDEKKIFFKDCFIKNCYMTGAYRKPPDFQLSISTFRDVCTLNCMLIGKREDKITGQYILNQIQGELLEWLEND